jgi:hypothetical protein
MKRANATVPLEYLQNGFEHNPQGSGFMYAQDGKLIIKKGFFTFEEFLAEYSQVPPECPAAIHFRLATHGLIDEGNCHPFSVSEDVGLIHNGVIPGFGMEHLSDTRHYAEIYLHELFKCFKKGSINFSPDSTFAQILRWTIFKTSSENRIILLKNNGDFLICGENRGKWIDDVWYSNNCMLYSIEQARRYLENMRRETLGNNPMHEVIDDGDLDATSLEDERDIADDSDDDGSVPLDDANEELAAVSDQLLEGEILNDPPV